MPNHWNTLASADLARTETFYRALGFDVRHGPPGVPCVTVHPNEHVTICFFVSEAFSEMVFGTASDAHISRELVQSLGFSDRSDVDRIVHAARDAGAPEVREPADETYGYAGGFSDPDGHVWAALCMV